MQAVAPIVAVTSGVVTISDHYQDVKADLTAAYNFAKRATKSLSGGSKRKRVKRRKRAHKRKGTPPSRQSKPAQYGPAIPTVPIVQLDPAKVSTMPRSRRRTSIRRSRRKSLAKRKRRTRRRSIRKRVKKRRISRPLATRAVPQNKILTFEVVGQHTFTSKPGQWGTMYFPMNCMEKPFGMFKASAGTYALDHFTLGNLFRQPAGYDRWIDAGTTGQGQFEVYQVQSSTVTLTHLPDVLSDGGANMISASMDCPRLVWVSNPVAITGETEQFENLRVNDLSVFWDRGTPFKGKKIWNMGHLGQSFSMSYNKKAWEKKYPDEIHTDPKDDIFKHDSVAADGGLSTDLIRTKAFCIGQMGVDSTEGATTLIS